MNELQREKLLILPLHAGNSGQPFIDFQRLFLFGLMVKLNLFTGLICKNSFLKEDINHFEAKLSAEQKIQGLYQFCQNSRTRYLLTGAVVPRMSGLQQTLKTLRINLRLYDSHDNRYLFDVTYDLAHFDPNANTLQTFQANMGTLNTLQNWASSLITNTIYNVSSLQMTPYIARHQLATDKETLKYLIQAENAADYASRIRLYEQAIKTNATLEYGYVSLGKIFRLAQNYQNSILYYQKAFEVSQCPNSTKGFYATEIGIAYALLGHHDAATQWWLRAIELAPTYINPYMNMGMTFEEMGNHDGAEAYFQKAQAIDPNDIRSYINLSRIYSKSGQWDKALKQYLGQLSREPNDPWCHNDLGNCYLQLGDIKSAMGHFEKTASLDPQGEAGQFAKLLLSQFAAV